MELLTQDNRKGSPMPSEREIDLPIEIASANPSAQAHYRQMIRDGQSERFAIMCSLQIAPGAKGTDRAFMEGRMNNQQFDGMPTRQANYVIRDARKAGINISGKHYVAGLADKRRWCDPEAWVSSNDDILKVAKKRQLTVTGSVNYDPPVQPPKRVKLNERIVKREVARLQKMHPTAKVGELRERVIEKHAYKVKGRGV